MGSENPPVALEYAPPPTKPPRRWRVLPVPVAVTAVVCGTLLVATPAVAVCVTHGQGDYGFRDDIMALMWATGAVGLLTILLGLFFADGRRADPDIRDRVL